MIIFIAIAKLFESNIRALINLSAMFKKIKNISKKDISKIISHGFLYTVLIIHFFDTDDSLLYLQYILLVASIIFTIVVLPHRRWSKK